MRLRQQTQARAHISCPYQNIFISTMKTIMFMSVVLCVIVLFVQRSSAVECATNTRCQCLPKYISCRGVIYLPDVLDSRLLPLREDPPLTADLRGNALTEGTLRRFLLVFTTIRRVMLTDQLESRCDDVRRLTQAFTHVTFVTDCVVSLISLWHAVLPSIHTDIE